MASLTSFHSCSRVSTRWSCSPAAALLAYDPDPARPVRLGRIAALRLSLRPPRLIHGISSRQMAALLQASSSYRIGSRDAIAVPVSTGLGIRTIRLLKDLPTMAGRFAMPTRTHHPACHLRVLRGVALGRTCPRLGGHARKDVTPEK